MTSGKSEEFSSRFGDLLVREGIPEWVASTICSTWSAALRRRPAGMGRKDFLEGDLRELVHTNGVAAFVARQTADAVRLVDGVLLGEESAPEV